VSGLDCMLLGTAQPSILPDFVAASDRSHCDFVCCAVRRGKMTDGPSAFASALANKTAFQVLFPGASKMAERVFRGRQASWHVEFIGKFVSVDQANLDVAGGDATLADKAFLWLTCVCVCACVCLVCVCNRVTVLCPASHMSASYFFHVASPCYSNSHCSFCRSGHGWLPPVLIFP